MAKKKQGRAKPAAPTSSKPKRQRESRQSRREQYKASTELLQYEAAAGSKAKLSSSLFAAGAFKTKTAAKSYVDRVSRGEERLSDSAKKILSSDYTKAGKAATSEYVEKKLKPRQKRGVESAARRITTKATKQAAKALAAHTGYESQDRYLDHIEDEAKHVYQLEDGHDILRVGDKASGRYAILTGLVEGDSPKAGVSTPGTFMKTYFLLLYTKAFNWEGKPIVMETIPGIANMNGGERAAALAEWFSDSTAGHGTLYSIEYTDDQPKSTFR